MNVKDKVVLVSGANRGIGLAFAQELLARGARKVYAAARDTATVRTQGVVPVSLDVTNERMVVELASLCPDVELLVNNAGVAETGGFLRDDAIDSARRQMETNFFGLVRMTQVFAPVLARNGGGVILNVLSIASWINRPLLGVYGASKSAAWAFTNGARHELRAQGTKVVALHMGFVETDLTRGIDAPKSSPAMIVQRALDELEAGFEEILADEPTRGVKQSLSQPNAAYLSAP